MSYLVGVEAPAQSVGELPLSYVAVDINDKAKAALANAQAILEIYRIKAAIKEVHELRYRPYAPFRDDQHTPEVRISVIRQLIDGGKYEEAIEESAALLKLGLEGLRYLQTYDWFFLRTLVTIGYLGWIAFAMTAVIDKHVLQSSNPPQRSIASVSVFMAVLTALYASFVASNSPPTYYGYALFPVAFWEAVYARRHSLIQGRDLLLDQISARDGGGGGGIGIGFFIGLVAFLGTLLSLVRQHLIWQSGLGRPLKLTYARDS
jgi:phosphatidylinositol glycan class N